MHCEYVYIVVCLSGHKAVIMWVTCTEMEIERTFAGLDGVGMEVGLAGAGLVEGVLGLSMGLSSAIADAFTTPEVESMGLIIVKN